MRTAPRLGEMGAPAPSYTAHRQRALAAGVPMVAAVVTAMVLMYVAVDMFRVANEGQIITYAIELAVPLVALVLARGPLAGHVEGVALGTDLAFTAVLVARLFLPTTTTSGTALFLSLKLLATALLLPWRPATQFVSAGCTLLLYGAALALTGRTPDATHQLIGPLIAAVLSCVGAAATDRTRRALWLQSVDLAASELRTRTLLEGERILTAIAREIAVLTDLRTALDRVNSLTATALDCEFSNTYLIDDERSEVTAAATNASDPNMRAEILAVRNPLDMPVVVELLQGHAIVINEPASQSWFNPAELAGMGVRRLVLMPITAKGKVVGVLTVTRTQTIAPFDEREVSLLKAIAAQAAIAIENAQLFEGLRASEARYRDLFERATDLIFVVDEAGPLRFANRAALDFIGVTTDQLHALRWQSLVEAQARRQIERRIALARRPASTTSTFEIEVHMPGGQPAVLELRTRLVSAPGQPRSYHCIARDVTERHQQERDTQQLLFKLREANRLQTEFVANMSHELRTPLNVIIGYADLLADDPGLPPDSDGRLFLQRIAAAGRALHRLVESVLEYARLDRGRNVILVKRFAATKLLAELRQLCDDVSGNTDVMLSVQDVSEIDFASDYDRLYSVLSNLMLNAIKFTAEGVVELRLRRIGNEAEFTVRDTGIGIESDALTHVFEPFRQVDGSPTRSHGGVGLGLAIVRRNVELLRGSVEVESQVGIGSTFRVRVPIALDTEPGVVRTQSAA